MTSSAVHTVAERLLDPITVTAAVPEPDAASLSHGLAGTALLHARLSTVDDAFAQAAEATGPPPHSTSRNIQSASAASKAAKARWTPPSSPAPLPA